MATKTNQTDAIEVLTADHRKVRHLLEELVATSERAVKKRESLLKDLATEIEIHSQLEEELFYPAFKEAAGTAEERKLYFEAHEEHHVADYVLAELKDTDPTTEPFGARAKLLKELIEHHADEEEKDMFPHARKRMTRDVLVRLATEIEERRAELLTERLTMPKPIL